MLESRAPASHTHPHRVRDCDHTPESASAARTSRDTSASGSRIHVVLRFHVRGHTLAADAGHTDRRTSVSRSHYASRDGAGRSASGISITVVGRLSFRPPQLVWTRTRIAVRVTIHERLQLHHLLSASLTHGDQGFVSMLVGNVNDGTGAQVAVGDAGLGVV